jgi:hypothetical protein
VRGAPLLLLPPTRTRGCSVYTLLQEQSTPFTGGKVNRHRNNEDLPPIHPSASTAIITTSLSSLLWSFRFFPVCRWHRNSLLCLCYLAERLGMKQFDDTIKARSSLLLLVFMKLNLGIFFLHRRVCCKDNFVLRFYTTST